jgi:hypothetical protein
MVCEGMRCDVVIVVVVKMVQTHSLGEIENGFLQSQILCGRNTREETCVDRKQEKGDSRRKGIPKFAPISQVPRIHHICPRRNMLALFRCLKKLDASATVRPVTSWLFYQADIPYPFAYSELSPSFPMHQAQGPRV